MMQNHAADTIESIGKVGLRTQYPKTSLVMLKKKKGEIGTSEKEFYTC